MKQIQASELIINPDQSIYHLNLRPDQLFNPVIVVGDPDRVSRVSQHFDEILHQSSHREFISHSGRIGNRYLSVISSGIGSDNVEILMNELDALVNVDFNTRSIKENPQALQIIRLGTSGALDEKIPIDSILASERAIGLDTLMNFYELPQNDFESTVSTSFKDRLNLPYLPYCVSASPQLLDTLASGDRRGNTLTCPGFYAPQARSVRLKPRIENLLRLYTNFSLPNFSISNFEMETAAYYAFARMMGHEAISLNAIIAHRGLKIFSSNPQKIIDKLIANTLEEIVRS